MGSKRCSLVPGGGIECLFFFNVEVPVLQSCLRGHVENVRPLGFIVIWADKAMGGNVNLPAEKRKAQVFAEIQRALHSPRPGAG